MTTDTDAIWSVLQTINDPEMPISIVDLGIVERVVLAGPDAPGGPARVRVDLTPTFVGCPALEMLRREIVAKIGALPAVAAVEVRFVYDPPWSVDRISAAGREALRRFGVTTPPPSACDPAVRTRSASERPSESAAPVFVPLGVPPPPADTPACPFCGAAESQLDSPFGPTRCRMIYYCPSCKNAFEHLKRV